MDEEQPIELWHINGTLRPVVYGPRALLDQRMDRLARAAAEAEAAELRAKLETMDTNTRIKQAIASYETRHKQDRKITLKQVCEEFGVNYGSTRVLKSRYAKQKRKRKVNSRVNKADHAALN